MNLLIDTNVILDMVQRREPFSDNSKEIIASCIKQKYQGFVSAHSLCDIYYILRKDLSVSQRLKLVEMFCQFFTVIPEKANDFIAVVQNPRIRMILKAGCKSSVPLNAIWTTL